MTLIMMESCDLTVNLEGGDKWDDLGATQHQVQDGLFAQRITANTWGGWDKNLATQADSTVIVGRRNLSSGALNSTFNDQRPHFGFFEGGDPAIDGVMHVSVYWGAMGAVHVFRGGGQTGTLLGKSADGVIAQNQWHYIEVKVTVHDTTGAVIVKVDNVEVVNVSDVDTRNGGAVGEIDWLHMGSNTNYNWFRDFVLMNSQGAQLNDLIGPVLIEAVLPDGAGDLTEWTPGAGTNWQQVDDTIQDGDSTYVESTTVGERDYYTFADFTLPNDPIAVALSPAARYVGAPLEIAGSLRRSSTNDDGDSVLPSGSYASRGYYIWETDPIAAAAWTLANANATQFGFVSVAQ